MVKKSIINIEGKENHGILGEDDEKSICDFIDFAIELTEKSDKFGDNLSNIVGYVKRGG